MHGTLCTLVLVALASADDAVRTELGPTNRPQGLVQVDQGDGTTVADSVAGAACRRTDINWPERPGYRRYIYLNVDDAYLHGGQTPVQVTAGFLARGAGVLKLEYDGPGDGTDANFRPVESRMLPRSGDWRTHTFLIPDAEFAGGCNGQDFRLRWSGGELYVRRVELRKLTAGEYVEATELRRREARIRQAARAERLRDADKALSGGLGETDRPFEIVTLFCGPLLAAQPGPWDGFEGIADDAEASWRRIVDYAQRSGFTRLVAGGVRGSGWDGAQPDYLYVVDWTQTDFPEAAVVAPDEVQACIDQANRILGYAADAGVPIWLHNYHFTAPKALVEAREDIRARDLPEGPVATNVDWASGEYQRWLETAWRETFASLPDLAGRYDTMGEMVFGIEDVERAAMEFTRLYARVHADCGRTPMMRNWWMHRCHRWYPDQMEHLVSPDIHYVMKFSHTDSVTRTPDAELAEWTASGLSMSSNVYFPGENARFFVWADPRFVQATVMSSLDIGMKGMTLSRSGPSVGVGAINDRAFAACASGELPLDRFALKRWQRYVGRLLGTNGPRALYAMERYAEAVRSLSRVVGEPCEGFDMQYTHFLPPRKWMSTLGCPNAVPPEEWREGIEPLQAMLDELHGSHPSWERLAGRLEEGGDHAISYVRNRAIMAEGGADTLDELEAEDADEMGLLRDNARAAAVYLRYWEKLLWARLKYEAILQGVPDADLASLGRECVGEFEACIGMLEEVAELLGTTGPRAELAIRKAELPVLREQVEHLTAAYAQSALRVEAERLDVNEDGEDSGYYVDLGGQVIRLGPPGVYPDKPHNTGYVTYRFRGDPGNHELRLEYQDDSDDPADTEGAITVLVGEDVVGVVELNVNDNELHTWSASVSLSRGDVITLRGRSDRTGNEFCRVDRLWLIPADR